MAKKIKEKQLQHSLSIENINLTNLQLISLTLVSALVYIGFSFSSDGFYQHDEAAHFINMRTFWYNPDIILGNWAKPGYKLLYVIPSLAGPFAVLILNALFAAGTSFFVYKTAQLLSIRIPLVAFLLLSTQPLWIQLSFRNYSEIPTAFLLSLACWLYYRKQQAIGGL
jgi:4-amino-4-deoxy-L-arabinose transferase-like glycosyltransferase